LNGGTMVGGTTTGTGEDGRSRGFWFSGF